MALVLDYSAGRIPGEALVDAGVTAVMRYLWFPGQQHAYLTDTEAADLRAHGIGIGPIFESTANRAAEGFDAGVADAHTAVNQLDVVGAPADQVVYFTIDFDAAEEQQDEINAYFRGVASIVGVDRIGCYGGFYPLSRVLNAALSKYGWQTLGWSGGNKEARAALYQNGERMSVAGVDCDINELTGPAGLWGGEGGGVSADDVTKGLFDTRVDGRNVYDWFIQLRQEMADLHTTSMAAIKDVADKLGQGGGGGGLSFEQTTDAARQALDGATIVTKGGTET